MRRLLASVFVMVATASLAASVTQTLQLERVMRQKLAHSERMLEAVVTSNWTMLDEHSRALQQLTRDPAWSVLMTPEYVKQTKAFVDALEELVAAARTRDLDKAPMAYASVTLSCVSCHRYVARARMAR